MALINKKKSDRISIDLTGPDGNVFNLLGIANRIAKKMEMSTEGRKEILDQMMHSDYTNAVAIFEINFGFICDLEMESIFAEEVQSRIGGIKDTENLSYDLYKLGIL